MTAQPTSRQQSAQPAQPGSRLRSEFEHLLQHDGCPVCRHVAETERAFFAWFVMDSFAAGEVQAQIRASMGMCPRHMRRLIDATGGGHVMTMVMRHAVLGARAAVRESAPRGPCPACVAAQSAVRRGVAIVLDGLTDPTHARLYAGHSGMCVRHVVNAVQRADPGALALVGPRLLDSLADAPGDRLIELVAGIDSDAEPRARSRGQLPDEHPARSTLAGLADRLATDTCPVCLSAGWIERRYIVWLVESSTARDASIPDDPGELCARHLHDVAFADRVIAAEAAARARDARRAELHALLDALAAAPPPSHRGRQGRSEQLEHARSALSSAHYCPACHAVDEAGRSQLSLVSTSLALAPSRDHYLRNHGLCVGHAVQVTDEDVTQVVRRHGDARLAVLGWELEETARKYAWSYRHEPAGPERHAWLRAAVQIDGHVFEGSPAPVG